MRCLCGDAWTFDVDLPPPPPPSTPSVRLTICCVRNILSEHIREVLCCTIILYEVYQKAKGVRIVRWTLTTLSSIAGLVWVCGGCCVGLLPPRVRKKHGFPRVVGVGGGNMKHTSPRERTPPWPTWSIMTTCSTP